MNSKKICTKRGSRISEKVHLEVDSTKQMYFHLLHNNRMYLGFKITFESCSAIASKFGFRIIKANTQVAIMDFQKIRKLFLSNFEQNGIQEIQERQKI